MSSAAETLSKYFCDDGIGFGPLLNQYRFILAPCFVNLVQIVLGVLFIITFGIRYMVIMDFSEKTKRTPIYRLKIAISMALVLLSFIVSIFNMARHRNESEFPLYQHISSTVLLACSILSLPYVALSHLRTKRPSYVITLYWTILALTYTLILIAVSNIRKYYPGKTFPKVLYSMLLVVCCTGLVLESKKKSHSREFTKEVTFQDTFNEETSRFHMANLFERLTISMIPRLAWRSRKGKFSEEEVYPLYTCNNVEALESRFNKYLDIELKKKNPNLFRAVLLANKNDIFFAFVLKLIQDVLIFMDPIFINVFTRAVQGSKISSDGPDLSDVKTGGALIALAKFGTNLIKTFCLHQYFYLTLTTGVKASTCFSIVIYRKFLDLTPKARTQLESGKIVGLLSSDADRIKMFFTYGHMIWSSPLQLTFAIYGLYSQLGNALFIGFLPMIFIFLCNIYAATLYKKLTFRFSTYNDSRIKFLSEAFRCITIIKLQAWETPIMKKITEVRDLSLKVLKKILIVSCAQSFSLLSSSVIITVVSFLAYSKYSEASMGPLTTTKLTTSLVLLSLLQYPLNILPQVISSYLKMMVGLKRIESFLKLESGKVDVLKKIPDTTNENVPEIILKNCSFSWSFNEETNVPVVRNIDIHAKGPSIVVLVGHIGSGKSTIMESIVGATNVVEGEMYARGRVAYCPQIPWIFGDTMKNNITFGSPFVQEHYDRIVDLCCLRDDINRMADGHETIVGERGFNLSGGQKQRLSLARALYANCEIYLIDDTLSALDARVANSIYNNVIGNNGYLKDKIRICSTQSGHMLKEANEIIVLSEQGEIVDRGSLDKVSKGPQAALLNELVRGMVEIKDKVLTNNQIPVGEDIHTPNPLRKLSVTEAPKPHKKYFDRDRKEQMATGSVGLSTYLYYFKNCGLIWIALYLLLSLLAQCVDIAQSIYLSLWSGTNDSSASRGGGPVDSTIFLIYITVMGTARIVLILIYSIIVNIACFLSASRRIHANLLNSVMYFFMSFFDTVPDGRIMNRFSADITSIDFNIQAILPMAVDILWSLLGIICVNVFKLPVLIPMFLVFTGVFYLCFIGYISISREIKRMSVVALSNVLSSFGETFEGYHTINLYNQAPNFTSGIIKNINQVLKFEIFSEIARRCLTLSLEVVENLISFFCLLSVALFVDKLSINIVGLVIIYSQRMTQRLSWFVRTISSVEIEFVSVERIKEYTNLKGEGDKLKGETPPPNWPSAGKIEFVNYSARYKENLDLVLRDINLVINPGEKIGIVGKTGAGKTSLALSVFRIFEAASGRILIDDVDISTIGLETLRSKLIIVPQDPILFIGSIRSNLDPFNVRTDEECWEALRVANSYDFVKNLKGGLYYEVTKDGENISVGERQLICIARAAINKSKVVILDESTSSVDKDKDAKIQKTTKEAFKDSTLLVIAHRLETILESDKILFMENGRIKEFGETSVLLHKDNGRFRSLVEAALQ